MKTGNHLLSLKQQLSMFLLLMAALSVSITRSASAAMTEIPKSFSLGLKSLDNLDIKVMATVKISALKSKDAVNDANVRNPGPARYAEDLDVNLTLANSGTWEDLQDGSRMWRLRIQSNGALSLNLGIKKFNLPPGAKLWIYDPSGSQVEGPFDAGDRTTAGELWTPMILGSEIVVELFVPGGASSEPVVEIGKVNHGYRFFGAAEKAGNCNIDVICPAGNAWRNQIRAVAVYTINGVWTCTGQLVNNTNQDFTPYFLTANHCGLTNANAANTVFYWNFESAVCDAHCCGSLADNQAGAVLRANWADSDFALLELNAQPNAGFNVYYLGWDATGNSPDSAVCIHHPNCDEKSISFDNNPVSSTAYFSDTVDANEDHWRVGSWDSGTTEPGSSGSCLYSTDTGLCIGQLHGGKASCANADESDWYGKISASWAGNGTNATRLSNWLDPVNTGSLTLQGAEPAVAGGPSMRVADTDLDYGEVELGFAATQAIVVYNDGDAALTLTVTNESGGDPDLPQWTEINVTTNYSINPGDGPLILTQVYEPTALGNHGITMKVSGNDLANPSQDVFLHGDGVSPIPIDSVLVLDRSGSMSENAGERRKIDAMRDAAGLFADLLRQNIGNTGTGDKLGFVKYNHNNEVYLELDFVDDPDVSNSHMNDAMDKLSDDALDDAGRLKPTGSTGIGDAIQTGGGMFTVPAGGRKHVMVVLTDGIETVDDELQVADIQAVQNNDPDLWMYSVGVGMNINPVNLQDITNIANGYHQVADDLSGDSAYNLELFYFKIFANATGLDLAVDPTVAVGLNLEGPTVIATARITSSDRKVVFVVLDSPVVRKYYTLELVAPNGQVMGQGEQVGGVVIHMLQRHTYTICKAQLPAAAASDEYIGDWTLLYTPKKEWSTAQIKMLMTRSQKEDIIIPDKGHGFLPIGFAAAVGSNYRMDVEVLPEDYLTGTEVLLMATLTDRGWPSVGGKIDVNITPPTWNHSIQLSLYDDGTHGDSVASDGTWSGIFNQTGAVGTYHFLFRGKGVNHHGEMVPREASRYLTLSKPGGGQGWYPDSQPWLCIPCPLQWLIVILCLVLLILIFVMLYRAKKSLTRKP